MPGPSNRPSGLTDTPQITFVDAVAKQTGLDPRVVYAWTAAEGAYASGGTGGYDFLNLRPDAASDVGVASVSPGGFDRFGTLQAAISSTVARIKQPFLQQHLAPVLKAGGSPAEQIAAIAASGWDSGHYTDAKGVVGGKLIADFTSQYGSAALGSASSTPLPTSGAGDTTGQQGISIPNPFDWVGSLTSWVGNKAGYAALYVALVLFAVVLGILGLLSLLGVRPKTALAAGPAAVAAA